ncbi:hypothetical protein [Streptomyces carminius]|uniref:hypothetical protein n=1 Tax=Streptomyces carminius TaxID=2665496 RepID=UPI000D198460|nr:hypothetical protein [Streptomyces carminius]
MEISSSTSVSVISRSCSSTAGNVTCSGTVHVRRWEGDCTAAHARRAARMSGPRTTSAPPSTVGEERATAAAKSPGAAAPDADGHGEYHGTYRRTLDVGHPVLTVLDTDPGTVAEQLHANLGHAHEYRQGRAGQTLGLAADA